MSRSTREKGSGYKLQVTGYRLQGTGYRVSAGGGPASGGYLVTCSLFLVTYDHIYVPIRTVSKYSSNDRTADKAAR